MTAADEVALQSLQEEMRFNQAREPRGKGSGVAPVDVDDLLRKNTALRGQVHQLEDQLLRGFVPDYLHKKAGIRAEINHWKGMWERSQKDLIEAREMLKQTSGKKFEGKRMWRNYKAMQLIHHVSRILHGCETVVEPTGIRGLVWHEYSFRMNLGERAICCHCGALLTFEDFTVEHLNPKILGGTDELDNLRPSCGPCNWYRPVEDLTGKIP